MTRKITERGSVVLVLSAAVLVIVIDARAGGMWLARGGGSRKGAKLAKWLGARGIHHEDTKFTKLFWGWRAGDLPRRHEVHEGIFEL